jgi:hypothetical protein
MSSLPANSARARNAVAASATHAMGFIVGLSILLGAGSFPRES